MYIFSGETMINIDLYTTHHVVAASNHTYLRPTQELTINRTLAYHDIIYLVEGEWTFVEKIDDREVEYTLKPDHILILTAGKHEFIKKPCQPGTRTYCVHITKEGNDLIDHAGNMKIEPFFSASSNPKIISYFRSACDAFWSEDLFNQPKADAFITLLFCEIARLGNEKILSDHVKNTIKLLNNNLHKTITKEELEKNSGLSYKKLSKQFKEETGQSIRAYQIDKKLEMIAMHLDTEPYVRMKELAATYNFYDEFYLSKLFKKKYGLSPIEYKHKTKKEKHKYDTIC